MEDRIVLSTFVENIAERVTCGNHHALSSKDQTLLGLVFYIHSSFATVLQQQKQRWLETWVLQRNQFTPRMKDNSTNGEYQKAVVNGNLWGNESALWKVTVEGDSYLITAPSQT